MSELRKCDGCGETTSPPRPMSWLTLEASEDEGRYYAIGQELLGRLEFCGEPCLYRWAKERHDRRQFPHVYEAT